MKQIYGYAFHSPLIIINLVPHKEYIPIYLDAKWLNSDVKKNVTPLLSENKQIVFLASLPILQVALKLFPDITPKVILFEFPGLINPFKDPLIEWIDCDHQTGGAWQTMKSKLESFETILRELSPLDEQGRELIARMQRFITPDRISEIEGFQEYMPSSYKDLVDYGSVDQLESNYESKTIVWKKKSLTEILKQVIEFVAKPKREELLNIFLDYQLARVTKRDFTAQIKPFVSTNVPLKKALTQVRKWMDDAKHGKCLYQAYLDYVSNLERRSWKLILEDHGAVDEQDLLLAIAKQDRDTPDILSLYEDDLRDIKDLVSNMNLPEATVQWSDGSFGYHPEPPVLSQLFDF